MDFVESIQSEGVELERKPMDEGTKTKTPIIIEVDQEDYISLTDIAKYKNNKNFLVGKYIT